MHQRAFDYSYQAFTADGAQWLVDNTDVALIGMDYLSIAIHDDLSGPHDIILGAVRCVLSPERTRQQYLCRADCGPALAPVCSIWRHMTVCLLVVLNHANFGMF